MHAQQIDPLHQRGVAGLDIQVRRRLQGLDHGGQTLGALGMRLPRAVVEHDLMRIKTDHGPILTADRAQECKT